MTSIVQLNSHHHHTVTESVFVNLWRVNLLVNTLIALCLWKQSSSYQIVPYGGFRLGQNVKGLEENSRSTNSVGLERGSTGRTKVAVVLSCNGIKNKLALKQVQQYTDTADLH